MNDEDKKLLKYLEIIERRIQHHHDALWEEEKHYTWWIYVLIGFIILVVTSEFISIKTKELIIIGISLIGIFISCSAYRVVRKEGEYFFEAKQIYFNTIVALKINTLVYLPNSYPKIQSKCFNLVNDANKPLLGLFSGLFKKRKLGIRDYFQLTFIIFFIIFSFGAIYTILNWYCII